MDLVRPVPVDYGARPELRTLGRMRLDCAGWLLKGRISFAPEVGTNRYRPETLAGGIRRPARRTGVFGWSSPRAPSICCGEECARSTGEERVGHKPGQRTGDRSAG